MLKCYFENVKYETQKYAAKSQQKNSKFNCKNSNMVTSGSTCDKHMLNALYTEHTASLN